MGSLRVMREEWSTVTGPVLLDIPEYLDKKNKHDYAYRMIKDWIIQGELPSDTILVERQLCQMLGLSRTPVRSALQELAKDGFVLTAPGRGMMVSRVQIEDVIEIFEIRRSLDILALELFEAAGHQRQHRRCAGKIRLPVCINKGAVAKRKWSNSPFFCGKVVLCSILENKL